MKHKVMKCSAKFTLIIVFICAVAITIVATILGISGRWLKNMLNDCKIQYKYAETLDFVDENCIQNLEMKLALSVPNGARFVDGYVVFGKDPTYVYIVEMDFVCEGSDTSMDEYVRNEWELVDWYSYTYDSNEQCDFYDTLRDLGYTFTNCIMNTDRDFAEIHYRMVADQSLQIALVYTFP